MRLRAVLVLPVLLAAGLAAAPAAAADDAPVVLGFSVPSAGPGSLTLLVAEHLAPATSTQPVMVRTDDPSVRFPLPPLTSSSLGSIVSPPGYRTADDVTPGTYSLEVDQDSRTVLASTWTVVIKAPDFNTFGGSAPGSNQLMQMRGVGGAPGIARSVSVDGQPVVIAGVEEEFDRFDNYFAEGSTVVTAILPADLQPGVHRLAYTQDSAPLVTITRDLTLPAPSLSVEEGWPLIGGIAPQGDVSVEGSSVGVSGATLTVRGTDGVVHALHDLPPHPTDVAYSGYTMTMPDLPVGVVTFTAVDKATGVRATCTATVLPSLLSAPARLPVGGAVPSPSGSTALFVSSDGNVVVETGLSTVWSTHVTPGTGAGATFTVQPDGNLVDYGAGGRVLWNSRTKSADGPMKLVVTDDGRAALTNAHNGVLWATPTAATSRLATNAVLRPGQRLQTERYALVVQSDGNLVLYGGSSVLWQTGTAGHPGAALKLQPDGNLVLYSSDGKALWAARAFPGAGAQLVVQSDGNLVEYSASGKAVWSSHTAGK